MYYKIENDYYTCEVDDLGAQLHSLKSKKDGYEYIWQGNPDIWYGQAPVLFPVIGQMKNDNLTYNGKSYFMPKHGLARKLKFDVKEQKDAFISFSLCSTEDTLKQYPFEFELVLEYKLEADKLSVCHKVYNKNNSVMYFSLGAHPGLNCAQGDVIEFEEAETVCTERIDKENLIIDKQFPLLDNEKEIVITREIFEPDALILSNLKSKKLVLKSENRKTQFCFGECPFLGIWAKPGAPYVCIEPWFGVNDGHDDYGEFSNKRGIQKLEAGKVFEYTWSINPAE